MNRLVLPFLFLLFSMGCSPQSTPTEEHLTSPLNVIIIYADDLGYGDLSLYGARDFATPSIDSIALDGGIQFTRAYSTASTCTPSRYSLLTGTYPWRKGGVRVSSGNETMLIDTADYTIADLFKEQGYQTAVVGKWHLGLGIDTSAEYDSRRVRDWSGYIGPGPESIGFDYHFIMPATGDRVPTVYVEDNYVVGLDTSEMLLVNYQKPFKGEPLGSTDQELLRVYPSHGHDQAIANGISRIGYQKGGEEAWWKDEDMSDIYAMKSIEFIKASDGHPFFLYLSTHDIHVPRVPHSRFVGQSGKGPRGDAILQLDDLVAQLVRYLKASGLYDQTILLFTSDNGPVLDDGYRDRADSLNGKHNATGELRGGKYSILEGGQRVPLLIRYPGLSTSRNSDELISQVDFLSSFAAYFHQRVDTQTDSKNQWDVMMGKSARGRSGIITEGIRGSRAYITQEWKLIFPNDGPDMVPWGPRIETGFSKDIQLYHLASDPQESTNLAEKHPDIVKKLVLEAERLNIW